MKNVIASSLIVAAALLSACGGKGSPTAPAATASPSAPAPAGPAAGSATITGSVHNAAVGTTVSITGTATSVPLDGAERFTLNNVPPGDVELRVNMPAASATVPVAAVQPSEIVEVVVNVAGAAAEVESEIRHGAGEAEVKGRVEAVPPATAAGTFRAAGRLITTSASTAFIKAGRAAAFADLTVGLRVEVKGTLSGDTLTATKVEIEDRPDAAPPTPGPNPPAPAPNPPAPQPGHPEPGHPEPGHPEPPSTSASIHGTLKAITGTKPNLTLTVDTTTVKTSSSTEVKRKGDKQTLDALKTGQSLHVEGDRQADGSINARQIAIDDDAPGGAFEVEGSMGGLKGTCPAITFGVNGFAIAASASTTFDGVACGALKNGDKVEVKGTRNADGSIAATRIKKS